ncbi:MAG: hypothetical protein OEU09_17925 [Rhodospirillales bacterium]|nr:hypothetical protein [Rhodospirillales bacterium]
MIPTVKALAISLTVGLATLCLLPACSGAQTLTEDEFIARMDAALDEIYAFSSAQPQHPLQFGANLFYAHETVIERVPLQTLLDYADALIETGVERIDINTGLFPWLDGDQVTIAKYDALIQHIRDAGVRIALNPQYSAVYHRMTSFSAWRAAALKVYATLARRYRPEIFVVVHEPTTMAARMGIAVGPRAWRDFAREAALIVKQQSPGTRCGAGGLSWEKAYFNAFASLGVIDVMTLDIYKLDDLETYNDMIRTARKWTKPVYIEETWRNTYYVPRPGMTLEEISAAGVGDSAFMDLDIKWLETLAAYASAWGLESMTPFWTQTFFTYLEDAEGALDPAYNRAVAAAIARGERTPTFHAFQDLVQRRSGP